MNVRMREKPALPQQRFGSNRNPEIRWVVPQRFAEKPGRRDTDDRHVRPVDQKISANHARIERKVFAPGSVTHNRGQRSIRLVVALRQEPAGVSTQSECFKIISRYVLSDVRLSYSGRTGTARVQEIQSSAKRGHLAELWRVVSYLLVKGVGENAEVSLKSIDSAAFIALPHAVQFAWLRHGQAFQHHRVDQREDGGVSPNSEREGEYGDKRETRTLAQLACSEANVLKQTLQRYESPHVPAPLLQTGGISELAARDVTGLFRINPVEAIFLFAHREVKRHFVVQITIQLRSPPKRLHAQPHSV